MTDGVDTAPPEAVEATEEPVNLDAPAAQDDNEESDSSTDETGDAPDAKAKKPGVQKRIDEITKAKYDAEREAEYWKRVASGTLQQKPPEKAPPKQNDFQDYDEFLVARAKHEAMEEFRQESDTSRQTSEREAKAYQFNMRAAPLRENTPDFDAVVQNPALPITDTMAAYIQDAESGPAVAYHLGTHIAEAHRISTLPPHMQAAELARMEIAISQPPPDRQPPNPPPKTIAGKTGAATRDPNKMSMSEYIKARTEGKI